MMVVSMFRTFTSRSLVFLVGLFVLLSCFQDVAAQDLDNSYIRLERAATNQSPGRILVVTSTRENVIEDELRVTVGSAWSTSANPASFGVSTAQLPAGVTAWPGIGTATSVSGSEVRFPSGDLVQNTQYGFYITGGVGANPAAGVGEAYLWNLATVVSSTVASQVESMVPVTSNDQVVVTGEVPALAYYFTADLASLETESVFGQGEVLTYEITYGSELLQSTPLTLQAEWSQGTVTGQGAPSIDVLSYVPGSASDAYGSTAPVIDTVARTITWTIPSMPASTTNQTVTFSLQTSQTYTNTKTVSFEVSARTIHPVTTSDSTVSSLFHELPDPSPTPSSSPVVGSDKKACNARCTADSECSSGYCYQSSGRCRYKGNPGHTGCSSVPVVEKVGEAVAPNISNVVIQKLSNTSATIGVSSTVNTQVEIVFGKNQRSLSSTQLSAEKTFFHSVTLSSLDPNTVYYFKVKVTDAEGIETISDMYMFKTADVGKIPQLSLSNTQMLSKNLSVIEVQDDQVVQVSTLPTRFPYEVFFSFDDHQLIKEVYYVVVNTQILGANEDHQHSAPTVSKTKLFETTSGVFAGQVESPTTPGHYDSFLQVFDHLGNIIEYPVSHFYVSDPLMVLDAEKGTPVERARVHFYRYNEKTQLYELLHPQTFLVSNPLFTNHQGEILVVFPHEKYRVVVDAYGYETQTLDFTLDADGVYQFPKVYLLPASKTVLSLLQYHKTTLSDIYASVANQLDHYSKSNTFYVLLEILSLITFAFLSIFALSARTHISPKKLLRYLKVHALLFLHKNKKDSWGIHGKMINAKTKKPVSNAMIVFFEKNGQQALSQIESNRKGLFHAQVVCGDLRYLVTAAGYLAEEGYLDYDGERSSILQLQLSQAESFPKKALHEVVFLFRNIFGLFFESLVIISLLFQFLFIPNLGFYRVLPFLILSSINAIIWLLYISSHRLLGE